MIYSTPAGRRVTLLALLLLLPSLAYADALDGVMVMVNIFLGVAAFVLVVVVVLAQAHRHPANTALQVAQWILLGICLLLGRIWSGVFNASASTIGFNPFFLVCLPVGAWLIGVRVAQRAAQRRSRQLGMAVAALGAGFLPQLLLFWLLPLGWRYAAGLTVGTILNTIIGLAVSFGAWWVVGIQVQRQRPVPNPDWQPLWLVPLLGAGVATAWTSLTYFSKMNIFESGPDFSFVQMWGALLWQMAQGAVQVTAIGSLALWLKKRNQRLPEHPV